MCAMGQMVQGVNRASATRPSRPFLYYHTRYTEGHLLKRRFMPRGWSDASLPVLGRDARAMAVLAH